MSEEEILDEIFNRIDDLLLAGDFEAVDKIIKERDFPTTPTLIAPIICVVLTSTLAAKDKLKERAKFFQQAEKTFGKELLKGLE